MEQKFKSRISYDGEIKDISQEICREYNLGDFKSNTLILVGYEDFNYILNTSKGKYVVKIFASFRADKDCKRYVEIMEKAMEKGISTPKLLKTKGGDYLFVFKINKTKLRLAIMDFIDGESYFESKEKLNNEEIKFLAHQAALINSIKLHPYPIYDCWAIPNFIKEYNEKSPSLPKEDLKLLKPLVKKFNDLKIEILPHAFVHGDIITTNIIKDKNKRLWIIDFSVSNYYPRIQELAVYACDLLFDEDNKEKTEKNLRLALEEYQKTIKLTEQELEALPVYIQLAHGMHVLCGGYEKYTENNNSEENEYFLNKGRNGLIMYPS